ncbi:retrovirus-related pol polyprotein from transposon TNT 1-94 [Tanacetum coccineum]
MHNNIMAGRIHRDRPPNACTGDMHNGDHGSYDTIDTRPNGDALRKCILKGPYTPTIVTTPAVPVTEDSPAVPEQTIVETVMNMTLENKAHFESEKEAIHLILTGIGDEIYSTVDACQTTQEIWEASERLQQDFWGVTEWNVVGARETVGGPACATGLGIQCFNCKEFGHYAKECRKPKRVKDSTYHKEKILLCKQAEKGVQTSSRQSDGLSDRMKRLMNRVGSTFSFIRLDSGTVPNARSGTDAEPLEQGDSNVTPDSPDMFFESVNARTKKPNVVPISTRKPKSQVNKSVATPHKKTVASESTITNSKSYYKMLYKKTNKAWKYWWIATTMPSAYTWDFLRQNGIWTFSSQLRLHHTGISMKDVVIGLPKVKYCQGSTTSSSCEVSIAEPKNIKEAMADSAWLEEECWDRNFMI